MKNINDLEKCFYNAIIKNAKYIAVKIKINEFPKPEIIINENANFSEKLKYYQNIYDDNLKHKHADNIRIIGFRYFDDIKEIEYLIKE